MSNCNCGDPSIGNTQRILSAFIQPGGASANNDVYPALAEGNVGDAWPGVEITNSKLNLRGARTVIRRRASRTKRGVIAGYRTAAAPDNTITLRFATAGCAGFMAPELATCGIDLYQKHSCCGDGTIFEDDFALYTIWTGLDFESIEDSDQTTFDDEKDEPLTIAMAASFVDRFKVFPLTFGEIAASTGLDTGGQITSAVYYDRERCGNDTCGEKLACGERWYAVTNEGTIIYKRVDIRPAQAVSIAGYTSNNYAKVAVLNNRMFVSYNNGSLGGFYYGDIQSDGTPPATWTQVSLGVNFQAMGWHLAGNTLYLFGRNASGAPGRIYIVDRNGSFTLAYSNGSNNTSILSMGSCGTAIMAVGDGGQIFYGSTCDLVLSALVSPTASTLAAVANQGQRRWWVGGASNGVYVSEDNGGSWTPITIPFGAIGTINSISWANENVGHVVWTTGSTSQWWTTWDGGNTWIKDGNRVAVPPSGNSFNQIITPCCENTSDMVNKVLLVGITSAAVGGVWTGSIQQC